MSHLSWQRGDHEKATARIEAREKGWRDEAEEFRRQARVLWETLSHHFDAAAFFPLGHPLADFQTSVRTAYWPGDESGGDPEQAQATGAIRTLLGHAYRIESPHLFGTSKEASDFDELRQSIAILVKRWQPNLDEPHTGLKQILRDVLGDIHTCTAKLLWYVDEAKAQKIGSHPKFGPHKALRDVFAPLDPCTKSSLPANKGTGPPANLRPLFVELN